MNNELNQILIGIGTVLVSFVSFFFAIRNELKKNNEQFVQNKLLEEKRHSSHEQHIAIIEERFAFMDSTLSFRLDEINKHLSIFSGDFYDHIKSKH